MSFLHIVLLSLDSLVAGCALAPLLTRAAHRVAAAVLVGAADAAASMLGALIPLSPHGLPVAAPAVLALYGVYLISVTGLAGRRLPAAEEQGQPLRARSSFVPTWVVLGALAAALSLDNLLSPGAAPAVVAVGACSAGVMLAGLFVGGRVPRDWSDTERRAWLGAGLVAVACLAVVG